MGLPASVWRTTEATVCATPPLVVPVVEVPGVEVPVAEVAVVEVPVAEAPVAEALAVSAADDAVLCVATSALADPELKFAEQIGTERQGIGGAAPEDRVRAHVVAVALKPLTAPVPL